MRSRSCVRSAAPPAANRRPEAHAHEPHRDGMPRHRVLPVTRSLACAFAIVLAGCIGMGEAPVDAAQLPAIKRVICEGQGWAVSLELLARSGRAERGADAPAAALRAALDPRRDDTAALPDEGWIEVDRTDAAVRYAVIQDPLRLTYAIVERRLGWELTSWGDCQLRPELPAGIGPAAFRAAPGVNLTPESTKINILVTELACNSGQDAQGRILRPVIVRGQRTVSVLLAVVQRDGEQECPSNPETPFTIELPEPLGDRMLLDGSEVPPRDARTCPAVAVCP